MSECIVLDARKVIINASQTISKGQRPSTQARSPEGLGRAVVGPGTKEVEGSRPLRRHAQERSRSSVGGDSQAAQRGRRPIANTHLHIRGLLAGDLPAGSPPQMEGVHSCDN